MTAPRCTGGFTRQGLCDGGSYC